MIRYTILKYLKNGNVKYRCNNFGGKHFFNHDQDLLKNPSSGIKYNINTLKICFNNCTEYDTHEIAMARINDSIEYVKKFSDEPYEIINLDLEGEWPQI